MSTATSPERTITRLVMDFDTARGAFELQKLPGWDVASDDLRASITRARKLDGWTTDARLQAWFDAALLQVNCWVSATDDVRRGLTPAVAATLQALSRYARNAIAEPEAAHGVGVR